MARSAGSGVGIRWGGGLGGLVVGYVRGVFHRLFGQRRFQFRVRVPSVERRSDDPEHLPCQEVRTVARSVLEHDRAQPELRVAPQPRDVADHPAGVTEESAGRPIARE